MKTFIEAKVKILKYIEHYKACKVNFELFVIKEKFLFSTLNMV